MSLDDAFYIARRFVVRAGRIVVGFVLGLAALWIAGEAFDLLGRPLAAASLLSIVGGLGLGWLAFVVGASALKAAFGEAPTRAQYEDARRAESERFNELRKQQEAKEQERLASMLALPLWRQALFDPTFARRRPGAYALVVAVGFAAIAAIIGLLVLVR